MTKIKITKTTPDTLRIRLIKFISTYGDGHITLRAIKWLRTSAFSSLNFNNGDLIHVCLDNNQKILAVFAVSHFGLDHSLIVVHPSIRKKGIARSLMSKTLDDIDRLYVKVANDNIPSLKLCFSIGMRAFDLTKGPTGKPTLIMGYGNFSLEEWNKYNS